MDITPYVFGAIIGFIFRMAIEKGKQMPYESITQWGDKGALPPRWASPPPHANK